MDSAAPALPADPLIAAELESSPDAVFVVRNGTATVDYNQRFVDLWGLSPELARAHDPSGIVERMLQQLRDPDTFLADIERFRGDARLTVHRELALRDGRVVECHSGTVATAAGETPGRLWFFRDVTAFKRASSDLEASHALLAAAERIAHVGAWQWDITHDVLVWSDETCRMFGRDPRGYEPTIADFTASIHPDDRGWMGATIEECVARRSPFEGEFRIVRSDGAVRTLHVAWEVQSDGDVLRMTGACGDVTEHRSIEQQLQLANTLLTAQIESSPEGILVVGADRKIVLFNQRFLELWRIPLEVVESRSDERALAVGLERLKDPAGFHERLLQLYANPGERAQEEIELKDGRVFERFTAPLPLHDGSTGRIFFFRDITKRKTAEQRVAHLAAHDVLTGLANRRMFVEAVQQAIARARRGGKGFALIYLDLDRFKDVNDTLGHPAGDKLLQEVASRLRGNIRANDLAARFGGDEFAILESDASDATEVAILAERLQAELSKPFDLDGTRVHSGASLGLTLYASAGDDPEALLSQADLALYRAKSEGRGTYRFYDASMDDEARARVTLSSELRVAIETGQLFLVYQPQVEIDGGRIVGLEALARWRHPRRGLVSPGEFIPVAEKTGLVPALGRWATREACAQIARWLGAGLEVPPVAVNVSALQFKTPRELETMIDAVLAEAGIAPAHLELELTESALMDAWFKHSDVLVRLRQLGVSIAIDDFGTGFSSLEYLSRFPVDRIKIAQTFVMDLASRPSNAAIVKATLGLARELGIQIIAEGVETREQLELLRAWGCPRVQGYLYAKPLAADDATAALRAGTLTPSEPRDARAGAAP